MSSACGLFSSATTETKVYLVDESRLIEKLRLIEALFAGSTSRGEKVAAERAKQRILERLHVSAQADPPVEYRFAMGDLWSRKLFVALLRRYEIRPYRYKGQRYTTVMARVSKTFVDETLWPEFQELSETLRTYLSEVTDRVVAKVIHQDSSEADVVEEPPLLLSALDDGPSSAAEVSPPRAQALPDEPLAPASRGRTTRGNFSGGKKRKKRKRR